MSKIEIAYSRDLATWESQHFDYAMVIEIILPAPGSWYVRARHYNDTESSLWSNSTLFNLPAGTAPVLTINYDSSPEQLEWTTGGMVYDVYYKGQGGLPPFRPLIIGTTDLSYAIGGQIAENGNVFKVNAITGGIAMQSNEETYQKAVPTNTLDHADILGEATTSNGTIFPVSEPVVVFLKGSTIKIEITECNITNNSTVGMSAFRFKWNSNELSGLVTRNFTWVNPVMPGDTLVLSNIATPYYTWTLTNTAPILLGSTIQGQFEAAVASGTPNFSGTIKYKITVDTTNLAQTEYINQDINVTSAVANVPVTGNVPVNNSVFLQLSISGEICIGTPTNARFVNFYDQNNTQITRIDLRRYIPENSCVTLAEPSAIAQVKNITSAITSGSITVSTASAPCTITKLTGNLKMIGVA